MIAAKFRSIFILSLLCGVAPARAQWIPLHQFSQPVTTIFFSDKVGIPSVGLAGLNDGEIWRTTDAGATWTQSVTTVGGKVSCFTFRDKNVGWCATNGGIYRTTDGGVTWSHIYGATNFYCVAFNPYSNVLCAIEYLFIHTSTDFGTTWNTLNTLSETHISVDFWGAYGTINSTWTTAPEYSTTDGGLTWQKTVPGPINECWSICAMSSTEFFSISELSNTVHHSSDGGKSWSQIAAFPNIAPTGCLRGSLNYMFVQTDHGFFTSSDRGITWYSICGPSMAGDTRFYSIGNQLWGADLKGWLWYDPDGSTKPIASISVSPDTLRMGGVRCKQTDSNFIFRYVGSCQPALTGAWIIGGEAEFTLGNSRIPRSVIGPDTLVIHYQPTTALHDTGLLLLNFSVDGTILDTVIHLIGLARDSIPLGVPANEILSAPTSCVVIDSIVRLANYSCDTLTLISATVHDKQRFRVVANLPKQLLPGDTLKLDLLANTSTPGIFYDTLHLHLLENSGTSIDTTIPIEFMARGQKGITAIPIAANLANHCSTLDTTFEIINTRCDTIQIKSVTAEAPANLLNLSLPTILRPGDTLKIPVHVDASASGSYQPKVLISFTSLLGKSDTSIIISLKVANAPLPVRSTLSAARLEFGRIGTPCNEAVQSIQITNPYCDSLEILSASIVSADSQFSIVGSGFPATIGPSSYDSLTIRFKPSQVGHTSAFAKLTLSIDGATKDTLIPLSGTGTSTFDDTVLDPLVQFDTVRTCEPATHEVRFINTGCGDIVVLSATFGAGDGLELQGISFPTTVKSGDTLYFFVRYSPNTTGALTDSIVLRLRSVNDPTERLQSIPIQGFGASSTPALVLPIALSMHFSPCDSNAALLHFSNASLCDSLALTSFSVSGDTGLSIRATPIILGPGQSDSIVLFIHPRQATTSVSRIRIVGNGVDTTVVITYNASIGAKHLSLGTLDSVFTATACNTPVNPFRIVNDGCDSITIDSVKLIGASGQTQFAIQGTLPQGVPANSNLTLRISFDPNGVGDSTADLLIASNDVKLFRIIHLRGYTISTPHVGVSVSASDGTASIIQEPGKPIDVSLQLSGTVPDSLKLTDVTATLQYNGDLLSLLQPMPTAGWSVISASQNSGRTDLQLHWHGGDASGQIASVRYFVNVTDSTSTDISISQLHFNDPSYESCTLTPKASTDVVHFILKDICGSPELRSDLKKGPLIDRVSVHPNPAGDHSMFDFTLHRDAYVSVTIVNALGEQLATLCAGPMTSGEHRIQWNLKSGSLPLGDYYYVLRADNEVRRGQIVLLPQ